ncbi:delta-aminolevulinic acid dehydratase [Thiohalorhabdus denitrificans]|uniref:Delta-aminolevulinic acid dehydratase n=1 Tax=Thiohalorhabdus denitrificans TaxID=381306 RepID=A0A0P9CJQ3_9GAMM|nr:porphobilinogen synthase [Thiohalorhabdus denitrificans]KPV39110.1 delta-aminolevulinic acid dehydratase [Thiohalorhabdus denitrificans]SCX77449.1 porphobilinogen synthase [Thiohalorhabdus denitrificans]
MRYRPRRLRRNQAIRSMVRENHLRPEDLIQPLFVKEGGSVPQAVPSMPGVFQLPLDQLVEEGRKARDAGLGGVILFGIPEGKDPEGSEAWHAEGIIQQAVRRLKEAVPDLYVIVDACFCEYTDHGHCGVLRQDGVVDNDLTLDNLRKAVVSYAEAGADMVAPSGMMDGMVDAIRSALDESGYYELPVMAYTAKYSSTYYGPFRDAAESAPSHGDRRGYQMDPANGREAVRELELDEAEGADIVMVKPGLAFMDVVLRLRQSTDLPVAVYNVSGEYSMIKAAAERGWIDERGVVLETLTGFKRAGADLILTYHALDAAAWLRGEA